MTMARRRLGKGLDALLQSADAAPGAVVSEPPATVTTIEVAIGALAPGRYQPRRRVSEQSLAELADSIREQGVVQPLVVRSLGVRADDDAVSYEIVAGERRWRAAQIAGLETVPAIVRDLDDQSALAVALIENLQREDLNPIDQAESLSRLASEFELTHEQVAKAVGRSRAAVTNLMRLLELEDDVKGMLADGRLDMGHARALLPLDAASQKEMARRVERRGLSVRQVEKAVRTLLSAPVDGGDAKRGVDLQTRWIQQQLEQELGRKLTIRPAKDGGYTLSVGFADLTELHDTLDRIQQLVGLVRDAAGPRARSRKPS